MSSSNVSSLSPGETGHQANFLNLFVWSVIEIFKNLDKVFHSLPATAIFISTKRKQMDRILWYHLKPSEIS